MVIFSSHPPSLTPLPLHRPAITCFFNHPHVMPWCSASPFGGAWCLMLYFRRVGVRLLSLTHRLIHPTAFSFVWPAKWWVGGRHVRRKHSVKRSRSFHAWIVIYSSPFGLPSAIIPFLASTRGMVSPSTIVLYLTLFCTALGLFGGVLPFRTTPCTAVVCRASFFLRDIGNTSMPRCTLLWCPPSRPCTFSSSRGALAIRLFPANLVLLYIFSISAPYPLRASVTPSRIRWEDSGAFSTFPTLVHHVGLILTSGPPHPSPLLCSFMTSPTPLPLCLYASSSSRKTATTPHTHSFSRKCSLFAPLGFFFSALISICFSLMGLLKQAQVFLFVAFFLGFLLVYIYNSG